MSLEKIFESIRLGADISGSKNIPEEFMLDSFDLVVLVEEIEKTFGIKFGLNDIKKENFKSRETIVNLIRSKGGKI